MNSPSSTNSLKSEVASAEALKEPNANQPSQCGDEIFTSNSRWKFEGLDPEAFESHAERSIPLYLEGHELISDLSAFFTPETGSILDIGCSTGRLLRSLAEKHSERTDLNFVGIDNSPSMLKWAEEQSQDERIQWNCEDLNSADLGQHDMIIAYYTVQFVPPRLRQELINRLYQSLNWGGALLLFEKVRGPDARFQDIITQLYTDYKLKKGYGPEEILNKTQSLKGILEPFSSQGNMDLLKRAGFIDITTVQRYLCFEGFLAIK